MRKSIVTFYTTQQRTAWVVGILPEMAEIRIRKEAEKGIGGIEIETAINTRTEKKIGIGGMKTTTEIGRIEIRIGKETEKGIKMEKDAISKKNQRKWKLDMKRKGN